MKMFKSMTLEQAKELYIQIETEKQLKIKENCSKTEINFYNSLLDDIKFFTNSFTTDY